MSNKHNMSFVRVTKRSHLTDPGLQGLLVHSLRATADCLAHISCACLRAELILAGDDAVHQGLNRGGVHPVLQPDQVVHVRAQVVPLSHMPTAARLRQRLRSSRPTTLPSNMTVKCIHHSSSFMGAALRQNSSTRQSSLQRMLGSGLAYQGCSEDA